MNQIEIAKGIYYVGAVDWNQRDFHGYTTPKGVTYNAYLIVDEKICLIDTVKEPFASELLQRVAEIVDPAKIDYVIVNHVEPDHSSALPAVMAKAVKAKIIATAQGKTEIQKHYGGNFDIQVIKEGEVLSLGSRSLQFIPLPMVHWPDSMVTYLREEQILFSNDAFGQHICTTSRFDDENDLHDVLYEAQKYYANILLPFSKLVVKALDKLSGLQLKMIAPSHGIVWRSHLPEILAKYVSWGKGEAQPKVVMAYDSMWGGTERMARMILDGLASVGVDAKLYRMPSSTRSEILAEILDAKGVIIGSSTLNNQVLPTIGALLIYLKGLKPQHKLAASFGAFGWAGGAQADIETYLQASGMELAQPGLFLKWTPDEEELRKSFAFGQDFGRHILMTTKE